MSKIEWTNKTWNPVTGCTKVSDGCKNCYAEKMHKRLTAMGIKKYEKPFSEVVIHESELQKPLHWKKPRMIFVNSMSDLFHENTWSTKLHIWIFNLIKQTPQHTYQILTKRAEAMETYCSQTNWLPNNLWLGVSVEDQHTANERIPHLLKTPAKVKWLSVEPLLEEIKLKFIGCPNCGKSENNWYPNYTICKSCGVEVKSPPDNMIDWVVVGCESGHKRRECKIEWIESIVEQCKRVEVPVFVKQISINGKVEKDINKFPKHLQIREYPNN